MATATRRAAIIMTELNNMYDVTFLTKKNAEITRLKLIQAGLIIVVVILAITLAAVALLSRFSQPTATPSLDVITREPVNGRDCKKLAFPKVVTAGESFQYKTCGQKLVDADATVNYQLTCDIEGAQQTTPLGNVYSDFGKGEFDREVSSTIPVSTRIQSSKKCHFTSIPVYTFYQVDQGGNQRAFDVKEPIDSTDFELIVPEDAVQQLSQTSTSAAKQPTANNRQQVATTNPSGSIENTNPTTTTSGGSGSGSGGGSGDEDDTDDTANDKLLQLQLDAPLIPPIGINLGR